MQVKRIGVLGAGQMGGGIAQVAAAADYHVRLVDASRDLAEKGRGAIEKTLARLAEEQKIDAATESFTVTS